LLRAAGWIVNFKRVERIWRREGLKVPYKQPKRKRLWFNDGSCIRLRAEHPNHVWSYDFVEDRTHDGRKYRMLNIVDEFTGNAWRSGSIASSNLQTLLTSWQTCSRCAASLGTFVPTTAPNLSRLPYKNGSLQSGPGRPTPSRVALGRTAIARASTRNFAMSCSMEKFSTACRKPGSSSNWRRHYNEIRPHSSLGYKPPAPEAIIPPRPSAHHQSAPPGAQSLASPPVLN